MDGGDGGWLSTKADLVTLVEVRFEGCLQFGVLRSITRRGALIQLREPPSLGLSVQVTFRGVETSRHGGHDFVLAGYVQHVIAWNRTGGGLRAVGIRWGERPATAPSAEH